jgi:hypothetical protein
MTIPAYSPVPVNNASIVSFITTDPLSLGLAAIRTASPGADAPLLAVLTPAGASYPVPSSPITAAALLDLVNAGEFSSMTNAELTQLQTLLTAGSINVGTAPAQAKLNSLFADFPTSLAAIRATYTRNGSPWEYWFGAGAAPTTSILDAARNSGGGSQF